MNNAAKFLLALAVSGAAFAPAAHARFGNQSFGAPMNTQPLFGNHPSTMPTSTQPLFGNYMAPATTSQPLFGNHTTRITSTQPNFGNQPISRSLANPPLPGREPN